MIIEYLFIFRFSRAAEKCNRICEDVGENWRELALKSFIIIPNEQEVKLHIYGGDLKDYQENEDSVFAIIQYLSYVY